MAATNAIAADFQIRALRMEDLTAALRLTQALRWSYGLQDWQLHFHVGRGFAAVDTTGELLGTILWWPYGEHYGSVGLVVVAGGAQGHGIGRALMNTVISDAGARSLQLVSTEAGLKLYQQCGFCELGSIQQHLGRVAGPAAAPPPAGTRLLPADATHFDILCGLDRAAFGADRSALLRQLLRIGGGTLAERDGRPAGFALHRPAGAGTTVGPIAAADTALAMALLAQELRGHEGIVRVDAPGADATLTQWLEVSGLTCVDRVRPMLRGRPPPRSSAMRIFGLASQAFG